jgi:hypothetical protein
LPILAEEFVTGLGDICKRVAQLTCQR